MKKKVIMTRKAQNKKSPVEKQRRTKSQSPNTKPKTRADNDNEKTDTFKALDNDYTEMEDDSERTVTVLDSVVENGDQEDEMTERNESHGTYWKTDGTEGTDYENEKRGEGAEEKSVTVTYVEGKCLIELRVPGGVPEQENARDGFENRREEPKPILDEQTTGDLDAAVYDESSCSSNVVQHTVKASLYGTDNDSSYEETSQLLTEGQNINTLQQHDENGNYKTSVSSEQLVQVASGQFESLSHQPQDAEAPTSSSEMEVRQTQITYQDAGDTIAYFTKTPLENIPPTTGSFQNSPYTVAVSCGETEGQVLQELDGMRPTLQLQNRQKDIYCGKETQNYLSPVPNSHPGQFLSPASSGKQYFSPGQKGLLDELASQLVQNFGGQNSHMITEILKDSVAPHDDSTDYTYPGYDQTSNSTPRQYSTPQMIQDVLSTPKQMTDLDLEYQTSHLKYGVPQSCSTPDSFNEHGPHENGPSFKQQNIVSYKHASGGKWTTNTNMYGQSIEETSENPFPPQQQMGAMPGTDIHDLQEYYSDRPNGRQQNDVLGTFTQQGFPQNSDQGRSYPHTNQVMVSSTGKPGEITKTTFTSREHMEMHLSNKMNYQYSRKQALSDINCPSIYPSKDFIERAASGSFNQNGQDPYGQQSNDSLFDQNSSGRYQKTTPERHRELAKKRSVANNDKNKPLKKRRTSKYSTEDLRVPPQLPLFDDMMQKYPPICGRDEIPPAKHKYFVVNPSEVTNMAPKTLITKYIDFLIQENEQITEISKLTNPAVDIYVTEDMYFMDSLKFKIPFPSKKFVEWVSNFYPCMELKEMKFKGRKPIIPPVDQPMEVDTDVRPTQVILEDTFYYFQREAMNNQAHLAL